MKKILFLFPYPQGTAASQRFRFEQYFAELEKNNFQASSQSFLDKATWDVLYKKGHLFLKITGIIKGFLRRFFILFSLRSYQFVFIHREASPIGPPVFEFIISKIFRKKIIFDFDDAIWLPNTSKENKIISFLKWNDKTSLICKWAYKISAGNKYLAGFASKYNQHVIINPTTIDLLHLHNKLKVQNSPTTSIGWTGTHSTLMYLKNIIPVIEKLEKKIKFDFIVICDRDPDFKLTSYKFIRWSKENELDDLLKINVGVMPLVNDEWAKGKCGFKALQYMALGIPAVASPVGVNEEIIETGANGFICYTSEDWEKALEKLLSDANLREKMGRLAYEKVKNNYAVQANCANFLTLFT